MVAGLSGILGAVLLPIGGPMIVSEYHNFLLCIVLFWVDKCTVRVLSFLFEGVACTVKVLLILSKDAVCTVKVLP